MKRHRFVLALALCIMTGMAVSSRALAETPPADAVDSGVYGKWGLVMTPSNELTKPVNPLYLDFETRDTGSDLDAVPWVSFTNGVVIDIVWGYALANSSPSVVEVIFENVVGPLSFQALALGDFHCEVRDAGEAVLDSWDGSGYGPLGYVTFSGPGIRKLVFWGAVGSREVLIDNVTIFFECLQDDDGDGIPNEWELNHGLDPEDPTDADDDAEPDGLTNLEEYQQDTDPNDDDTDDEGLTDGAEVNTHSTDPNDADSDDDELTDGAEVNIYGTDPNDDDTDDDGLTDSEEVNLHNTDPNDADTDNDGALDGAEVDACTDPQDETDVPARDMVIFLDFETPETSSDPWVSFTNARVVSIGTEWGGYVLGNSSSSAVEVVFENLVRRLSFGPLALLDFHCEVRDAADTVMDSWSRSGLLLPGHHVTFTGPGIRKLVFWGSDIVFIDNATIFFECLQDDDGDGMSNEWELDHGLDPTDPDDADVDAEPDGLTNLQEFLNNTDPNDDDTDGDGLNDGDEVNTHGTDPTDNDTDDDLIPDNVELDWGYDPTDQSDGEGDADGDGLSNSQEYVLGSDPNLPDSDGDGLTDAEEYVFGSDPARPESLRIYDATGGVADNGAGIRVDFPAGCLSSASILADITLPGTAPVGVVPEGLDLTSVILALEPSGAAFDPEVTVTVGYDSADLNGVDETTLTPLYWTGTEYSSEGLTLVSLDADTNTLVFTATHFTIFVLVGEPLSVPTLSLLGTAMVCLGVLAGALLLRWSLGSGLAMRHSCDRDSD